MTMKLRSIVVLTLAFCVAAMAQEPTGWKADISSSGVVTLSHGKTRIGIIRPGLFEEGWRDAAFKGSTRPPKPGKPHSGQIKAPSGIVVDCTVLAAENKDGLVLRYSLTPRKSIKLNSFNVAIDLPVPVVAGQEFLADKAKGRFPKDFDAVHLHNGTVRSFSLGTSKGPLNLSFAKETSILYQDNRKWGPSAVVRVGPSFSPAQVWPAGKKLEIAFTLSTRKGITVTRDQLVTIAANKDWVPLQLELDIKAGSALDFSEFGQIDAPAGKHGWITANDNGDFVFANDPKKTPRRFYGINLCFSAHYLTHEQSDVLAERLLRLGYNTVRFHHYEPELVDRSGGTSTALNKKKLDQLDYLFAALKKRGLYITTDLFTSRPVFQREIWPTAAPGKNISMNDYKMAIPVNQNAYANWQTFARNLLTHMNPYTKLRYADDPALAWICLINEGNFGNYLNRMDSRVMSDWQRTWNQWLTKRYGTATAIQAAWKTQVKGDPAKGTVPFPTNVYSNSLQSRDLATFLGAVEVRMVARMKAFLRETIKTKALLPNSNGWTNLIGTQAPRAAFDYVDDHFYVDHPRFLDKPWRLPSRCPNTSPIAGGATGGRPSAFVRLMDKPFTLSEYNYSGPGRFRGVGGILTGAMAALQGWGSVWRFAYSHRGDNLFTPSPANYFDMAADPLNQAAERASICLFLRGDMRPAPHAVTIALDPKKIQQKPSRNTKIAPPWHALALITRVGSRLQPVPGARDSAVLLSGSGKTIRLDQDPYAKGAGNQVIAELRKRKWLAGNRTDLGKSIIESETGQLLIDAPRDIMLLNTPRTAGGYAPQGETIRTDAAIIKITKTDATVWVSSVDGKPIKSSERMILTHLTDLQNTGATFAESARQTLLTWGRTPHLVLDGEATVTIATSRAREMKVWALTTSGRRQERIKTRTKAGSLMFSVAVRGKQGARLIYEVALK